MSRVQAAMLARGAASQRLSRAHKAMPAVTSSRPVNTEADRAWLSASQGSAVVHPPLTAVHQPVRCGAAARARSLESQFGRRFMTSSVLHRDFSANCRSHVVRTLAGAPNQLVRRSFSSPTEPSIAEQNNFLRAIADMRKPHLWFPQARQMKRKWVVHVGPTNSGKTHQALARLAEADRGVYCGPLRLLAWEVHEKLNEGAIAGLARPCSLITGQEKIVMAGAGHISSTIEMVDLRQAVDVGVIDEVQMLNSEDRGWAWTRTVLGLPVDEMHLCGEARTIPLLEKLCAMCDDHLEIKEYQRLSPLQVSSQSLGGSLTRVQAGDCVVSFSRKEIYKIKETIEKSTPLRCCVVYGSLPPQTRKDQAKAFNSTDKANPFSVLVASDAVGMGLNLKIKRVVFSETTKFDGERVRRLHKWEMLQIGGRAGRYGAKMGVGEVTCLHDESLPDLQSAFDGSTMRGITHAFLRPELSRIEDFAAALNSSASKHLLPHAPNGEVSLSYILKLFQQLHESGEVETDESVFHLASASLEELRQVSVVLEDIDLPLPHRLTFCMSPVDVDSHNQRSALIQMARDLSHQGVVQLFSTIRVTTRAEQRHAALELYLWLAQRFTDAFPDLKLAQDIAARSNRFIQEGLKTLTREQSVRREKKSRRRRRARRCFAAPVSQRSCGRAGDSTGGGGRLAQQSAGGGGEVVGSQAL